MREWLLEANGFLRSSHQCVMKIFLVKYQCLSSKFHTKKGIDDNETFTFINQTL